MKLPICWRNRFSTIKGPSKRFFRQITVFPRFTSFMTNNAQLSEAASVYKQTYETLFAKLSKRVQEKVLLAMMQPNKKDSEVDAFVNSVITLAEADDK